MKTKLRVAIIVVILSVIATTCVLITGSKEQNPRVTLIFQRYSDLDPYALGDVAFLGLTNSSNQSILLSTKRRWLHHHSG